MVSTDYYTVDNRKDSTEAINNTQVNVSSDGYTSSVSSDTLTNNDFLKLMIQELKMQDPTKPMDSDRMMDNQLKMSTIESNLAMSESMEALRASYSVSALATAANMVGKTISNGEMDDDGLLKSYKVETVENIDGELYVTARQMVGYTDIIQNTDTEEFVVYDANGFLYDGDTKLDFRVELDENNNFILNEDGEIQLIDENGDTVTDDAVLSKYIYYGSTIAYADDVNELPISSITEIR